MNPSPRFNCSVSLLLLLLLNYGGDPSAAKKVKVTTTVAPLHTRKVCHRQGSLDQIFTRTFSVRQMQRYCEMLDSFSAILRQTSGSWRSIATRDASCYDVSNWRYNPAEYNFLLKALFRHHIDVNKDARMDRRERERYLGPALRYHLLPGLLPAEYRHLLDRYFRTAAAISEPAFVGIALRMLSEEWPMLTRRILPDLDDDNCITKFEFARAVCRKRISDIDFYFRLADLDNNRAVTRPEFEIFKSITPVEAGEELAANKFFSFFSAVSDMISSYSLDYYQQTSYAHDDMITFNEVNLYICEYVI